MNLYVFPSLPDHSSGYGVAVNSDYNRLVIGADDIVIWYTEKETSLQKNHYIIRRYSRTNYRRYLNLICGRASTELSADDFKFIDKDSIDEIFCGEVVFYRALRKLFPEKKITVRFHNCFARIQDRVNLLGLYKTLGTTFKTNLKCFYKLEKEIFSDMNTHKIFISKEDRDYYVSNFGRSVDSEVWGLEPDMKVSKENRTGGHIDKFVWYGGLFAHKIDSLKWFIADVYKPLKQQFPHIEFHLYGKGSDAFNEPEFSICGHGFYNGTDRPYKDSALYVNPDLTGGGVKIKLIDYFESGVKFITTPFGYEGYSHDYIDGEYCIVLSSDEWLNYLVNYLNNENNI